MMIKTGYLHLLNGETRWLSLSDKEFDTIHDQFGEFLENNIMKLVKNHDRQRGVFKEESFIGEKVAAYQRQELNLYDISTIIARRISSKRDSYELKGKLALFIMEVYHSGKHYLLGIEVKRMAKYEIICTDDETSYSVDSNNMILSNATPKSSTLFMIDLTNLELTLLENGDSTGWIYANEIFEAEMENSLNENLILARVEFYQTLTKIEGRVVTLHDIESEDNLEKIEYVNRFEVMIDHQLSRDGRVDFKQISNDLFFEDSSRKREFVHRLENKAIPLIIERLSDAKIELMIINRKAKDKRLKLKNGIEIIVPEDCEEIGPIHIQEVDGELVEVEESE